MVVERKHNPRREPVHPGRILSEFMEKIGVNQTELAEILNVSRPHLNEIINGKRGISPSMAVKLSTFFDTTATFWKNLDTKRQLWKARREEPAQADRIRERMEVYGVSPPVSSEE